jgi:hypothetical protein
MPHIITYDMCSSKTGEFIFPILVSDYVRYSPRFCVNFSEDYDHMELAQKLFPIIKRS